MKIMRIYTGADNESHFEEKEINLKFNGDMEASELEPATGVFFRQAPANHLNDFHPAPRRQYIITLSGEVDIEIGDGAPVPISTTSGPCAPGDLAHKNVTLGALLPKSCAR